jgi:DNA repair protein RadD
MESSELDQAVARLRRIGVADWRRFFRTEEGASLKSQIDVARDTLAACGRARLGQRGKPIAQILDLLGDRLLSDRRTGSAIREMILHTLPTSKWATLFDTYREVVGQSGGELHGNMVQHGSGSVVMAEHWHQGSRWARSFCEHAGLPECFAETRRNVLPPDEDVVSATPLPELHDFQVEVYKKLRRMLGGPSGTSAILSLPTGAGKTRVAVEAVVDHLAEVGQRRNVVLWIAQSDELQRQAWECFRHVWQAPPDRLDGKRVPRPGILRIVRAWGARRPEDITLGAERTVVIAGVQQLGAWVDRGVSFLEHVSARRLAAVVIDEAHRVLAQQHRDVLVALSLRATHHWRPLHDSPPVIGLTATPWRTIEREDAPLRAYFRKTLLTPQALGRSPIGELQRRRILAKVRSQRLLVRGTTPMTASQQAQFEQFHELPNDYVAALGRDPHRNGVIVDRLLRLPKRRRALVFACSVEHAAVLTLALNRAVGRKVAALVTGKTPRSERYDVLAAFQRGELRFLCNVGVLTTGFDAPKVDVVCLTRPTGSTLLYEQMIGRGLRGPRNGGTRECLVLDVQDEGLPDSIMSYARVVKEWRA